MAMKAVGWLSGKLGVDISGHGAPNQNHHGATANREPAVGNFPENYGRQNDVPFLQQNNSNNTNAGPHGTQQQQHGFDQHHHHYQQQQLPYGSDQNAGVAGPSFQQGQHMPQTHMQHTSDGGGGGVSGFYANNSYDTPHAHPSPQQQQQHQYHHHSDASSHAPFNTHAHAGGQQQHDAHRHSETLQNATYMGPASPSDDQNSGNSGGYTDGNSQGATKLWGTLGAKVGGWVSKEKLQTLTQKVGTGVAKVNQGMSGMGKLVFGDETRGNANDGVERDMFGNVVSAENGHTTFSSSSSSAPNTTGRKLTGALDMGDADENGLPGTRNWYVYDKENKRWTVSEEAPDSVKEEYYAKLKEAEDERNGVKKYVPPPPPPPVGGMPPQHAPMNSGAHPHMLGGAPRPMYAQNEYFGYGGGGGQSAPLSMPMPTMGTAPQPFVPAAVSSHSQQSPQYFNPSATSTPSYVAPSVPAAVQHSQQQQSMKRENEAQFVPVTAAQVPQQTVSVTSTTSQMGSPPPLGSVQSPSVPFPPPAPLPSSPHPSAVASAIPSPTAPHPPPVPVHNPTHSASQQSAMLAVPMASVNAFGGASTAQDEDPFAQIGGAAATEETVPMVPAAAAASPTAAPPQLPSSSPANTFSPPRVPQMPFAVPQVPNTTSVAGSTLAGVAAAPGALPAPPKFVMPAPPSFATLPPPPTQK